MLEGRKTPQVVTCLNAMALVEKKMAHYARAMELYEEAMKLATGHDDNLRVVAELNLNIADVNRKLEKYDAAMKLYETAHNMAKKLDNNKKLLIGILVGKGLIEKKNSHFDAAIALYQEALKLESKGTAKWAEIAYNYADVLRKQEKLADAKTLYEEALVVTEATLGPRHAEVAEICNALGMLEKKNGDYANARLHYERGDICCFGLLFFVGFLCTAMSIVSELFGPAHPKIGIYSVNLGDIERKLGDFEKAEIAYGRAIPLLEAALGPDNVELADALNSQGLVLKKKADYDGAEVLYRRAFAIIIKTFNALHYKAGQVQNNLADCYRKRGQYTEALGIYEEAQAALMASLGPTHSETAEVWHNIALVLHQLGRYTEALELFHKAIAVIEKEFGKAHYKMGVFQNNCGLAYAMAGDFPKAYGLLTLALDILRKKLGNDHVEVADSLASLGDVCMKLFVQMNAKDKLAEAKTFYEEANRIVLAAFGAGHPKSLSFASLLAICESQAEQVLARDQRPIELVQIVMYDVSGSMETKTALAKHAVLDRREISKAFFGAFIDKEIAYQYPHALGLVTFGDRVTVDLPISRDFESFASLFGQISNLQPATHLLDGVVKSAELISAYCKENAKELAKDYKCRILCLSDGEDSGSKFSLAQALESLQKAHCVFDSIPIEGSHAKMRALSNAAGGQCFLVKSFEEGLSLFEREAVLSLRHRPPVKAPESKGRKVEELVDACPYTVQPRICEPEALAATLAHRPFKRVAHLSVEVVKRVSAELKDLLENPLPGFTISAEDLAFWVFKWKGAGPYEGVTFVGYCDLSEYPLAPPEVRFHTPIFHCNINNDGRVCLDLLSSRSWGPDIRMRNIFQELAVLLLNPNAFSALDTIKGSLFRENRQQYLDTARAEALKQQKH